MKCQKKWKLIVMLYQYINYGNNMSASHNLQNMN